MYSGNSEPARSFRGARKAGLSPGIHIADARLLDRAPPTLAGNDGSDSLPSILEKSATARVAARISLSSFSRFSRSGLSSTLTVTLSKKASTCGRSFAMARMAASKSSRRDGALGFGLGDIDRLRQRFFLSLLIELWIGRAGVFALVLLLLDADDVGRALVAGEQVLAVLGVEEFSQRLDAADDQQKIVLAFERKHSIDESCRAPCSRSWTFNRSAKKARRSIFRSCAVFASSWASRLTKSYLRVLVERSDSCWQKPRSSARRSAQSSDRFSLALLIRDDSMSAAENIEQAEAEFVL